MNAPPAIRDLDLRRCIHCGLCLESCPTYALEARESESPRGRILLLRAFAEGTLDAAGEALDPITSCLGCGSCEPACPSGVGYRSILFQGRETLHGPIDGRLPAGVRLAKNLLLFILAEPLLVRMLSACIAGGARWGIWRRLRRSRWLNRIHPGLEDLLAVLPDGPPQRDVPDARARRDAGAGGETVMLFRGCVAAALLPDVEPAARRLLRAAGWRVEVPRGQGCCGALAMHYGDPAVARACLRRNVRAFATGDGPIAVTAAGCGAALREAAEWLPPGDRDHEGARILASRVRDLSVLLADRIEGLRWRSLVRVVAYQDACHLKQVQGVSDPPRVLLRRIPGLELRDIPSAPSCCGSAGLHSYLHPDPGRRLAAATLDAFPSDPGGWLVSANPGCVLHLRQQARRDGRAIRIAHIAEVLSEALIDEQEGRP